MNSTKKYSVSSYFYRIEFQQRGAPHAHMMLWLQDQHGDPAPSLWNNKFNEATPNEDEDQVSIEEQIEEANDELIACSIEEANCPDHSLNEQSDECEECNVLKESVRKFQTHSCTFTCTKKRKIMKISGVEGLGKSEESSR